MNEYEIDPMAWFGEREVKFTPPHFIVSKTPLTPEARSWIYRNLKGRFSFTTHSDQVHDTIFSLIPSDPCPAFELPEEALAYELKWA